MLIEFPAFQPIKRFYMLVIIRIKSVYIFMHFADLHAFCYIQSTYAEVFLE